MVHANQQLIAILKARGPAAAVDIDNAASRITLDVIGRVGFDKDFGATQSLDDSSTNRAFDLMTAGEKTRPPLAHQLARLACSRGFAAGRLISRSGPDR